MEIERNIYSRLKGEIFRPEISILIGSRQVGKTFLLKELQTEALNSGKRVKYFNLEIPSDLLLFNKSDVEIFEFLTNKTDMIIIDEFHYYKNASHIFKAIFDSDKKIKIFASGSSSIELHKHLKESLAGRRLLSKIHPLSFQEYSQLSEKNDNLFNNYLNYGGLPGLIHYSDFDEKIRLLDEIYSTYIQKDIKSLIKEENIRAFNMLIYLIASYQGSLISVNNLAREIGLTPRTVEKHLEILEKTFIIYPVHSFSGNISNELKKSRKIYLYDLGIRNAILKDFSGISERKDKGVIYETFILHQIITKLKPNMRVMFWRDKAQNEIDFIVLHNNKPYLLEVKSTLSDNIIPKAMKKFIDNYPSTVAGFVFSEDFESEKIYKNKVIKFLPFKKLNDFISSDLL